MAGLSIRASDGSRRELPLDSAKATIGRSRESDVFLPDQWLSRHHAEIRNRQEAFFLADLGSKNGTLLNGDRVEGERRLRDGDVITLGEHVLTFYVSAPPEPDEDLPEPAGTQVFSARELSEVASEAPDSAQTARLARLVGILMRATNTLLLDRRPQRELFDRILELLFEAVPAERGAIVMLEGTPPQPAVKASHTRVGQPITRVSRTIARRVLERLEALLLPNLMEDSDFKGQDSILSTGIRSAVCSPLWFRDPDGGSDAVIGLVYLDTRESQRAFTEEDLRVVTALASIAAAKIENARLFEETLEKRRMEQDMQVAAEIQRSLLPGAAPELPGWDLVGSNEPCRTVGGDYYDFERDPDGALLMALGDVSGKGTGAALLMTVLRAAVRAHWSHEDRAEAVRRINRTVCQNIPRNKFITFFLACLDPDSGRLRYVNAGHNPPLLVRRDGSHEALDVGGMVLGMFETASYEEGSVELRPGDVLVVFSDGITETWSPDEEEFGEDKLLEVGRGARERPAAELQCRILEALETFSGGARATDDRTLIVLKRLQP